MENEKITVIVPIYKVEKYLKKCVDSIRAQSHENLEIILVDDGSPDGCGALCDGFAAEDARVRVIHKQNGGLSSARNAGLDMATGAYIGFVDSDDHIDPDMYRTMLAALKKAGADIALCNFHYVDENGAVLEEVPPLPARTLRPEEIYGLVELDPDGWRFVSACNRLYRRRIFDGGVRFREGMIHEDELSVVPIYERCRLAVTVDRAFYWDVGRPGSIMTSSGAVRRLDGVTAYLERCAFYRTRHWEKLARAALDKAYRRLWYVMDRVDVRTNRAVIGPLTGRTARAMARGLDPRCVWLWLRYIRGLLTGPKKEKDS